MISYMKRAFRDILDNDVDWMDDETKQGAYDKLDNMIEMLGYPDEMVDFDEMSRVHEGLEVLPGKYLETILGMER